MSSGGPRHSLPLGHDLLARYLNAYANARQLSDLERPWGFCNDGLDRLWMRLMDALQRDPKRLNEIISDDLSAKDRDHIASTLIPLTFALPLRAYPAELRAVRNGARLVFTLRHFASSNPASKAEHTEVQALRLLKAQPPLEAVSKDKRHDDEPIGFLPAALTQSFTQFLRERLRFEPEERKKDTTISSWGRRRRVRVSLLTRDRGIVVRFLERLPSPADAP
ncbi:MAG: hypothetical protein M5U26_10780 [Planctomycetota bacterium]|nr:hypothetical protein [Planctomycetota bacterium]